MLKQPSLKYLTARAEQAVVLHTKNSDAYHRDFDLFVAAAMRATPDAPNGRTMEAATAYCEAQRADFDAKTAKAVRQYNELLRAR